MALSATLLGVREDVHTLHFAQRQMLYPMGTEEATENIRGVLVQDGQAGDTLNQMTAVVLRQKLGESAAMASYQDLFAMFAILALVCFVPVLLLRSGKQTAARGDDTRPPTDAPKPVETAKPERSSKDCTYQDAATVSLMARRSRQLRWHSAPFHRDLEGFQDRNTV